MMGFFAAVHEFAYGPKPTYRNVCYESVIGS